LFKRFKMSAVLSAIVVSAVVGMATQAFAAGSVVPGTRGGSGSAAISGYAVTDVDYTFGQTGSTIDAVTFNLDRAATSAKVTLDAGATWHACSVASTATFNGTYAASCSGVDAAVASANQLTVVAKNT
jgi:hypothetical protein